MRLLAGRLKYLNLRLLHLLQMILEKTTRLFMTLPARIIWAGDSNKVDARIGSLLRHHFGRLSLLSLLRDVSEQVTFSGRDLSFARALEESTSGKMERWTTLEAVQVAILLCEINFSEKCLLGLWGKESFLAELSLQDFLDLRASSTGALYRLGCFAAGISLSIETAMALDKKLWRRARLWGETTFFSAVGHLTLLHYTLLATQQGLVNPQDLVLIRGTYTVANSPYADWLERLAKKLDVQVRSADEETSPVEPCLDLWPMNGAYSFPWHHHGGVLSEVHKSGEREDMDEQLEVETDLGLDLLSRLGWDSSAPTVGFHIQNRQSVERSLRNSKPEKYFESMARLISEGNNVVLLGELNPRDKLGLPGGVLLAGNEPDKFLRDTVNIAVWRKSQFFVGNNSGGTLPPGAFKTPTLFVDLYPITSFRPPGPRDRFQPKLPFSFQLERFLSLSEIFRNQHRWSQVESPRLLARAGYSVREVRPEEIDDGVREMQQQCRGLPSPLSKAQEDANAIYRSHGFREGGSISASFLQNWTTTLI